MGQNIPRVDDNTILKVFEAAETPVLTAKAVADELPITKDAVLYRLNKLADEGRVGRMQAGSNAVVWWAEVTPELSDETVQTLDERAETNRSEYAEL